MAERARRVPLQQLVGTQAFWRHEFKVTRDVLTPRPETELLVEASLEVLRDTARPLIVDVGTGSGCIALSLAAERPDARVHATDVSPAALAVARENARRLGLADRVSFHEGDLLQPLASQFGAIDLVVSNPPYVDERERGHARPGSARPRAGARALRPRPRARRLPPARSPRRRSPFAPGARSSSSSAPASSRTSSGSASSPPSPWSASCPTCRGSSAWWHGGGRPQVP